MNRYTEFKDDHVSAATGFRGWLLCLMEQYCRCSSYSCRQFATGVLFLHSIVDTVKKSVRAPATNTLISATWLCLEMTVLKTPPTSGRELVTCNAICAIYGKHSGFRVYICAVQHIKMEMGACDDVWVAALVATVVNRRQKQKTTKKGTARVRLQAELSV